MSPVAQNVIQRLDATRQRWWLFTLLTTAVLATSLSMTVMLVFMLTDALVKFSQVVLLGMFLTWLVVTVALVLLLYRRLTRGQRSLEATARRVESQFPELGSNLINLVQLGDAIGSGDPAFREAAIRHAAAEVGRIPLEQAATRENRWRRFVGCMQTPRDLGESFAVLAALVLVAVACHLLVPTLGSAANRLFAPWTFVPSVGSVEIVEVTPGDADILIGASLPITARINNPENKPHEATAWITTADGTESDLPMTPDAGHALYTLTLPSVTEALTYRLEIGDSQTRVFTVGVRQKPTIEEVEVTLHFPAYLGRADETVTQRQADLEAPQYTVAELRIRPSTPIAEGHIESGSRRYPGRVEDAGRKLVIAKLPMVDNGTFTVHMENDAGHVDTDPRVNQIRVLADRPPTVELLKPDRQATAAPGDAVEVTIRGADDHGLGRVRMEMKIKNAEEADTAADAPGAAPERAKEWAGPFEAKPGERGKGGENTVVLEHKLALPPDRVKPGQTVLVRAVAWDRRDVDLSEWGLDLKPQETAGAWHAVRIIDKQDKAATTIEEMDNLRTAIYKILTAQIQAQVRAATIPKTAEPVRASMLADAVRASQVDIQKTTIALVKSIGETDNPQRRAIRGVLHELTVGPMLDAVRQGDTLVKIRDPAGFAQPATELTQTQGRIIDALRTLLDVARRAQTEALAEMAKRPGGDLPDDVRKKLEAARDKLEEFLKQQKKVIEATENLAKKPVEDYTDEEKELMKQLAATEDDWSRFMKDFHSDMSKLAEQDFANPSMLKELNELQTELKMAEDALTKKTADIAVPLEQLGYEMAEEIKTNMEKWLPDKPDRERWSQEESLTDQDKEAPMAELPGELEDLIGELAEEEEDLFDEMEDVSSSAADSLDKGAGWDALDGPISNMSAKGATGNQLPNTSEMSGRSGEGRSGKSSGEFVGDEAIGKGGRKTPSRLTADPNEKGQIKDHSKDPVGGATGGGKESGQGGQGLEGPQPRQPGPRDLQRLAGKQAALRNKAEGVDVQLSIMNFHHTDLKKMIEVMAQVESDLKAGRYQNALRQRQVLAEGLGNVKRHVEGEVEIRQDTSVNVPSDIQKEILGGMNDPSPSGWEEMNRRYFERLSAGGGER